MINVSTVQAKLGRSGVKMLETFTWVDTPDLVKEYFNQKVFFQENEKPIISYYHSDNLNWLLTTTRLIVSDDRVDFSILIEDVEDVDILGVREREESKMECDNITIKTKVNQIEVKVEPGTWSIIFSIFKFILIKA